MQELLRYPSRGDVQVDLFTSLTSTPMHDNHLIIPLLRMIGCSPSLKFMLMRSGRMDDYMFFKNSNTKNSIEYIIVGLGNPDKKYEKTRHNAGFMAVDAIAMDNSCEVLRVKFKSMVGEITIAGHKCLLMKPQTYMNNSGQAVVAAMNFYKVKLENVIVIYDDISLEPSKIRIRRKGSDGGHNGIKSIIALTGGDTFPRIKLGVGKKPHPDYDLADWVLSTFKDAELKSLAPALESTSEIVSFIVEGEIDDAMNKYNT